MKGSDLEKCDNCAWCRINGMFSHEIGCPTGYLHMSERCRYCGDDFGMTGLHQDTCPACARHMAYE